MTNYVFGKFYKTKCGRKALCFDLTNLNNVLFITERGSRVSAFEIESEWPEEKPKRKVKLYAYLFEHQCIQTGLIYSELKYFDNQHTETVDPSKTAQRVPSEDREVEVYD